MSRFSNVYRASSKLGLIVVVSGVLGLGAGAQSSPTLQGEFFHTDGRNNFAISCGPGKVGPSGHITFYTQGKAAGPVSGTFAEKGGITFDGIAVTGSVSFEIFDSSGSPIAVGSKVVTDGTVTCAIDTTTGATTFVVKANLTYTAKVGGVSDEGEATLDMAGVLGVKESSAAAFQFTEIFHTSKFANTPGKVTGGGQIEGAGTGVTFGFNAQSDGTDMKGSGIVIDRTLGTRIKILTVEAFAQVGTRAAFSGTAEVNGEPERYRIDVDDLTEPGAGADTFKIVTATYTMAGTLTGGNIQTHK